MSKFRKDVTVADVLWDSDGGGFGSGSGGGGPVVRMPAIFKTLMMVGFGGMLVGIGMGLNDSHFSSNTPPPESWLMLASVALIIVTMLMAGCYEEGFTSALKQSTHGRKV